MLASLDNTVWLDLREEPKRHFCYPLLPPSLPLLPSLLQAGAEVRNKCLKTILRILYHAE